MTDGQGNVDRTPDREAPAPPGPAPYQGPAGYPGPAPYADPGVVPGPPAYAVAQHPGAVWPPPARPGYPPGRPGGWLPPPPARRTHRWGLGAFLLAEAVFLLVSMLIGLIVAVTGTGEITAGAVALSLGVPSVLAAVVAVVATLLRGAGPRIDLALTWSWRDVGLGLAFGFGGLFLTLPASFVYVSIVGSDASTAVGDAFGDVRASLPLAVLVAVLVVLVVPLCEEILYRGLLWGGVEKLTGRWWAFWISTLIFALAHFEFTRTPLLLVVALPVALARLFTGRLLASVVAHQVNNLLPGIVLALGLTGAVPLL